MNYNFVGKTAGQLLSDLPYLQDPADLNNAAQELGRCVGYHALENGGYKNYDAFRKTIDLGYLTHQLYDGFANPQLEQRMRKMVNYKVQELQNRYMPLINQMNKHKSEHRTIDRLNLYGEMKNLNKIYQKIFGKKLEKGKIKPEDIYIIGIHSGGDEVALSVAESLGVPLSNVEMIRYSGSQGDKIHLIGEPAQKNFYKNVKGKYVILVDDTCVSGNSFRNMYHPISLCRPKKVYAGTCWNNFSGYPNELLPQVTKLREKGHAAVYELSGEIKPSLKTKIKRFFKYKFFRPFGKRFVP